MEVSRFQELAKKSGDIQQLAARIVYKLNAEEEDYLLERITQLNGDDFNPAELNSEEFVDLLQYLRTSFVEDKNKWPREDWMYAIVSEVGELLYDKTSFINTARVAVLCCLELDKKDSTFFMNKATEKKVQKSVQQKKKAVPPPPPPPPQAAAAAASSKKLYDADELADRYKEFLTTLK